jgi:hypothetical protein
LLHLLDVSTGAAPASKPTTSTKEAPDKRVPTKKGEKGELSTTKGEDQGKGGKTARRSSNAVKKDEPVVKKEAGLKEPKVCWNLWARFFKFLIYYSY